MNYRGAPAYDGLLCFDGVVFFLFTESEILSMMVFENCELKIEDFAYAIYIQIEIRKNEVRTLAS